MEIGRAQEIIRKLADGRDPLNGQPFPANSPYQQSDIVRALHVALEAMDRIGKSSLKAKPTNTMAANVGVGWTEVEEKQLCAEFHAGKSIAEIARIHGRKEGGITARLLRLSLISPAINHTTATSNRPSGTNVQNAPQGSSPQPNNDKEDDDLPG